jgi:hypothetical protein
MENGYVSVQEQGHTNSAATCKREREEEEMGEDGIR